jgi:ABC-type protease/lipase transport system fused ATPase/permease subunit
MRINTGDVRLVVVDEPSAAMDPAGEFALFKNLREARRGKTMILYDDEWRRRPGPD